MEAPKEPSKRLDVAPGESIWEAMARELAANPDSPASLQIMSGVNKALKPRTAAVDQLVEALARQMEEPHAAATQAAVDAAVAHWEKACGSTISESVMVVMREDASDLFQRRRRAPPLLESIVAGVGERPDVGYELGVHLEGLRGTWHRLWASISSARLFGETQEQQECVAAVRTQFEDLLGRALSPQEWEQLTLHAHRHCEQVSKPLLERWEKAQGPGGENGA